MDTWKGMVKYSTHIILCCLFPESRALYVTGCVQIWQHRKEAVRANVAQRITVVCRNTYHLLEALQGWVIHETVPPTQARHHVLLHVQERGPVLDDVEGSSSDTIRATEENSSSSSATAGIGIDGEELGIELARVVNDVKVRQLLRHA